MKVKEAVDLIRSGSKDNQDLYRGLCEVVEREIKARVELRSHGKKPTDNLVAGVIDEVCDWGWKVGRGVGMTDDRIKLAVGSERGVAYARYQVPDPKAVDQIKRMRKACQSGQHPIEVLTMEGLDAMSGQIVGSLIQTARDFSELGTRDTVQMSKMASQVIGGRLHPDKPLCPYGVKARFCKHQKTLCPATSKAPLPTSVEQLEFYCKIDPKDCDWEEEKGG